MPSNNSVFKFTTEPDPSWIRHAVDTFYIPTQFVATRPGRFYPKVGRVFSTGHYVRKTGDLQDYTVYSLKELYKLESFNGIICEQELLLAEVWQDGGNEGLVSYELIGWMTLPGQLEDRNYIELYEKYQEIIEASIKEANGT